MTPASFIEINSITVEERQCSNERDITAVESVVGTTTSLLTGPATLISEMMHSSDHKKMRLHCRVAHACMHAYMIVPFSSNYTINDI